MILGMKNTFHELFGWGENFGGIGTNVKLLNGDIEKLYPLFLNTVQYQIIF